MAGNTVRFRATLDDDVSKKLDRIDKGFQGVGRSKGAQQFLSGVGIGAGVTAFNLLGTAVDKVAQFAVGSIEAASNLNETISKSDVIFGTSANSVQAWAETMDDAGGQSKRAALDAAAGFAGLFKVVGIGLDDSTVMSEKLTQLGSDLASFFNTDVDSALNALKSGLNGESEPLRQFNVFLSETAVKAKAVEMGLKPVNGVLTEGQKAAARYQLILEQTTDAQGDFARTADGMANSGRELDAKLENLQARIGEGVIPAVEGGTSALLGMLDAVDTLTDKNAQGAAKVDVLTQALDAFALVVGGPGAGAMHDFAQQQAAANAKTDESTLVFGRAKDSAHLWARAVDKAGRQTEETAEQTDTLSDALDKVQGQISTTSLDLDDLESSYRDSRLELQENIDKLHALEKIKHPTREQRRDIEHTRQSINDSKRAVINTTLKLHDMGHVSFAGLVKRLNGVDVHINDLKLDALTLLRLLTDIGTSTGGSRSGGPSGTIGGHAGGGWVGLSGPELSWKGERGPEYVISNDEIRRGAMGSPSSGGSPGDVTVRLEGVSKAQLMDMVDRELYVMLRRTGTGA